MKQILRSLKKYYNNFTFSSRNYWEVRYRNGGNSGSGSYNKIAEFKGKVINEFIYEKNIKSLIDFGCGDGNQATYFEVKKYIGIDVSPSAIAICTNKFKNDDSKLFIVYSQNAIDKISAELSISFDVLYHLIEDKVFKKYINDLFGLAEKYVVIFSTNIDRKNCTHHQDRIFTEYIEQNFNDWVLTHIMENPFKGKDSMADFYFYERK